MTTTATKKDYQQMAATDLLKELFGAIQPLNAKGAGGEKATADRIEIMDALTRSLTNGLIDSIISEPVESFDDWEERVYGEARVPRPGGIVKVFKIQSLTVEELNTLQARFRKEAPQAPRPPIVNNVPDLSDPNYMKQNAKYAEQTVQLERRFAFWVLEKGWVAANEGITIPGDTEDERFKNLMGKVAGDLATISAEITMLSNLSEVDVSPL